MTTAKYDRQAEAWTEKSYANAARYLARRAELIARLGPPLEPGDTVLDLACGDAGLAEPLLERGLRYLGVDASEEMVAAARRRVGDRAGIVHADLNGYEPTEPVAATSCFRAIYYARDRGDFFRRVARYTEKKLVFDLNPRQYQLDDVLGELDTAGLRRIELRPFFTPQSVALPGPLASGLEAVERAGPLARLALRFRFTYVISASP